MNSHSCAFRQLHSIFKSIPSRTFLPSPKTKTSPRDWLFAFLLCLTVLLPVETIASEVELTPEEQAWIAAHPMVRMGVGRAFPPFQYMDKEEVFQGIASDYLKLLEQRLGLKILVQKHLTWNQVIQKTKAKEIDAWACVAPTPERREYMRYSKPYLRFPWVIFTRKDAPLIAGTQDLKGKRVSVVKNLANYPRLIHIPGIRFNYVKSPSEGLVSVSVAKADAYVVNLAAGDYLINKNGLTNLKVASATDWGTNDLCMASRRDWPLLASIMQKGLDSVSQHQHDTIVSKWLHVDIGLGVSWSSVLQWSLAISIGVVLLFGLMLFWNRRLQREIHERQKAESALQQAYSEVDELVRQRTSALQASQEHLNLALNAVSAYTWEVNIEWDGDVPRFGSILFSPNVSELLGVQPGLNVRVEDLPLEESDRNDIIQLMNDFLRGEESTFYLESPVITRQNGILWHAHSVHVNRRPPQCHPEKAYGISVNIHHRKMIEEELKRHAQEQDKLNAQLMELDSVKSSIITNVSHELRTPLTSLLGFANLTRKSFLKHFSAFADNNGTLQKKAQRIENNLTIIENESRRLTRLINDFLDLSKIQSQRMLWNDRSVDVGSLIKRVAASAEAMFLEKNMISFQLDVPPDLPNLVVDPDRLEQVLQNLLHNAYKFTNKGYVRLGCRQEDDSLVIYLADTGKGIAEGDKEHIFTRFHRVESEATYEKTGGTGLGLSICKEIVNHYHGTIEVQSELGKGSEFLVRMPL